jgi:heat shock protein beta
MAIVENDFGLTGHMERLMAAQGGESKSQQDMMLNMMKMQKKTLEINPAHPIIKTLLERVESNDVDGDMTDLVTVLYETTSIRSGYPLADITGFTKRVETIIRRGVGVSLEEEAEINVKEAAEKTKEEQDKDDELRKQSEEIDLKNDATDVDDDDLLARLHDEL